MSDIMNHETHAAINQAADAVHSSTNAAANAMSETAKAFGMGDMMAQSQKAFEAPLASMRDVQERSREFAEKSLAETRAQYSKMKAVAEEATSTLEATWGAAKNGMIDLNVKAIEAFKANADSSFDFFKSLASSTSMAEVVTLQSEFARKQFDAMSEQGKSFAALVRKVADQTVEPVKSQMNKAVQAHA